MNKEQKLSAATIAFLLFGPMSVVVFLIGLSGDQSSTLITGAIGILLFIILPSAFYLLKNALIGAALQLKWAKSSNGFVGVIAFIFSWLLLMPIMIIWALIWGTISRHKMTI